MKKLVTYLTDAQPPADSPLVGVGLVIFAAILFAGLLAPLVIYRLRHKDKPILSLASQIAHIARFSGALGLLFLFLRYQGLAPFQFRGWVILLVASCAIWLIIVIRRYRGGLPTVKQQRIVNDRYAKYLPTAKPKR